MRVVLNGIVLAIVTTIVVVVAFLFLPSPIPHTNQINKPATRLHHLRLDLLEDVKQPAVHVAREETLRQGVVAVGVGEVHSPLLLHSSPSSSSCMWLVLGGWGDGDGVGKV